MVESLLTNLGPLLRGLGLGWFLSMSPLPAWSQAPAPTPSPSFQQLQQVLERHGIQVLLALPPQRGAYGLFSAQQKRVWIHPIVFELGIGDQTLVHEAVHVAQACLHHGMVLPLGLEIEVPAQAGPFYQHYQEPYRRQLEIEALAVQARPDRLEFATHLVKRHCSPGAKLPPSQPS